MRFDSNQCVLIKDNECICNDTNRSPALENHSVLNYASFRIQTSQLNCDMPLSVDTGMVAIISSEFVF